MSKQGGRPARLDPSALWLAAGLWAGLADGVLALHRAPGVAGPWLDRGGTIAVSMALGALAALALAGAFAWPARRLARRSRFTACAWQRSLVAAAVVIAVSVSWLRRDAAWREPLATLLLATVGLAALFGGASASVHAFGRVATRARGVRARSAAVAGGFAVASALALATMGWASVTGAADRPNILLISIDTLRADHLGSYGYAHDTSPNLDRLAASGAVFETAVAASSWTLPSHATLFTGLDPIAHGIGSRHERVPERLLTLAERLRDAGYATSGWVGTRSSGYIGERRGFDQGFDRYFHRPYAERFRSGRLPQWVERQLRKLWPHTVGEGRIQTDAVLRNLASGPSEPFFTFLHFYDVHSKTAHRPYDAPEPFRDRFCPGETDDFRSCDDEGRCATSWLHALEEVAGRAEALGEEGLRRLVCLYDGGIAFVDHQLGRLFAALEAQGLDERTIVVVTSDHGEALLEHGSTLHRNVYDEVIRVPLIVRVPGAPAGLRIQEVVGHVDLLPTLLELAGAPPGPGPIQGRSLAMLIAGEGSGPPGAEKGVVALGPGPKHSLLLRDGAKKYIANEPVPDARQDVSPEELYDLDADPAEGRDLSRVDRAEAQRLRTALAARRRSSRQLFDALYGDGEAETVAISDAERGQLRALGYAE